MTELSADDVRAYSRDVRAYSREVRRRVRAGLEAKCFCGHPKWMHSMEKPHPCSHCTGCARYDGGDNGA